MQRRLTLAVVATIVCAPLLLLDLLWSSGSDAKVVTVAGADVTEVSSASVDPATAQAPTTLLAVPSTVPAPPTTTPKTLAPVTAPAWSAPAPSARAWSAPAPTTTVAPPPPPPPPPSISGSDAEFLACVRARESGGDYGIVDGSGSYMGAYQFSQSTWDSIAWRAGRADLAGRAPNTVSPADQDAMAWATLAISGRSPWGGVCG
jgi:hypothetical protein